MEEWRNFRVDVPDKVTNEGFCSGEANDVSDANEIVYNAGEVCPSCLRTFNSKSVKMYRAMEKITEEVDVDLLQISTLSVELIKRCKYKQY